MTRAEKWARLTAWNRTKRTNGGKGCTTPPRRKPVDKKRIELVVKLIKANNHKSLRSLSRDSGVDPKLIKRIAAENNLHLVVQPPFRKGVKREDIQTPRSLSR